MEQRILCLGKKLLQCLMVESKLDLKRGEDRGAVKLMDGTQICQCAGSPYKSKKDNRRDI